MNMEWNFHSDLESLKLCILGIDLKYGLPLNKNCVYMIAPVM